MNRIHDTPGIIIETLPAAPPHRFVCRANVKKLSEVTRVQPEDLWNILRQLTIPGFTLSQRFFHPSALGNVGLELHVQGFKLFRAFVNASLEFFIDSSHFRFNALALVDLDFQLLIGFPKLHGALVDEPVERPVPQLQLLHAELVDPYSKKYDEHPTQGVKP